MSSKEQNKKKNPLLHLVSGGIAGLVESSLCHPLDTIKTRMQLRRQETTVEKVVVKMRNSLMEPALRLKHSLQEPIPPLTRGLHEPAMTMPTTSNPPVTIAVRSVPGSSAGATVVAPLGPIGTARRIVQREGFFALYKGLSAVYTGIIPKMAIRFLSFEQYRELLKDASQFSAVSVNPNVVTFFAGMASGLTEAVLVVTPAEVCKIRMQSQQHSLMDPVQIKHRKYRNVFQTAFVITREEGISSLYKGVVPTMLRQGCNQAVNFSAYHIAKKKVMEYQNTDRLAAWQSLTIGGLSGGMGPLVNNPLDVVKTRLQKQVIKEGQSPKVRS